LILSSPSGTLLGYMILLISIESFMQTIASMTDIKRVLRALRKKAGLSQKALAQVTVLTRTAIQFLTPDRKSVQTSTLFLYCTSKNHPLSCFLRKFLSNFVKSQKHILSTLSKSSHPISTKNTQRGH
jgi:transcriptional regulator with XRE-family HTH domain